MFRNRDILALLAVLVLVRTAWNNGVETVSSAVDLAFFFPRQGVMVVSPMDVDGDGTQEALAVVKAIPKTENFKLHILDLKPLHQLQKNKYLDPFRPQVIFSSDEINDENAHPIHLTTGQLLLEKRAGTNADTPQKYEIPNNSEINDQTRKYFCGKDWHDASTKCKTPCPSGQASECPGDERCYADTSCDIWSHTSAQEGTSKSGYELTPGGGLPSIVSLWGNGVVMLHSLTNGKSETSGELGLKEMWRYRMFEGKTIDALWEEINVVFLDAYSSMEAKAENGMIVVSASYYPHETPGENRATLTIAIDALKGTKLWESHSDVGLDSDEKPLPLPMAKRGQTSFARRRSSVAKYMHGTQSSASASALPNCMALLKKAVKHEVFPYSYWGPQDAGVAAIHLNQKEKSNDRRNHKASKPHEQQQRKLQEQAHPTKKWHHKLVHNRKKHRHVIDRPIQGKPNALVTQTRGGLQIRSLRNGKALCHLALLEENLYSDLNNDGVLDQIQVALQSKVHKPDDKFVWQLAGRLHEDHTEAKREGETGHESGPLLCHLLGLSGIPAKEEMFSAPICGKVHERPKDDIVKSLDSINPVVVESLGKRPDKHDIIVALNNGMIHRIQGTGGRRLWALSGTKHIDNFPTWESNSNHKALLSRIDAKKVPAPLRPLLLSGDNGLAVLSVTTGHLLAHVDFPQTSAAKPLLADLSGDGSTDVVIQTNDGIWGYRVAIHHHFPVTQRILVGLMMMFLMLATIRNRYSKGGKRSTDL